VAEDLRTATPGESAGQILRAAREKRGLHIAALAASLKVPQRKLEALEGDRYDELPDMAFTRALSLSVCRSLKIDPQPVLQLLPATQDTQKLAQVANGMHTPFNEASHEFKLGTWLRNPAFWATVAIVGGAGLLAFAPDRWMTSVKESLSTLTTGAAPGAAKAPTPGSNDSPAAGTVSEPVSAGPVAASDVAPTVPAAVTAPGAVETVHSAPPPATASAAAEAPAGLLTLRASQSSWVDVQDARGQSLLSRTLQAGETVGLEGALPLRVKVGNAVGTEVFFKGQPVDLAPMTRDNTARLTLK
jgi:cytoskeleton protein RodZ